MADLPPDPQHDVACDEAKELRRLYALAKAQFTAADLARYATNEKGIPIEEIIAELEEIVRQREAKEVMS